MDFNSVRSKTANVHISTTTPVSRNTLPTLDLSHSPSNLKIYLVGTSLATALDGNGAEVIS